MNDETVTAVRDVLREHARLPVDVDAVQTSDDLFQTGLSSHASVNVMLALEDRFDLEFPDAMLTRSAFESIDAIVDAVSQLQAELAAG